MSDEPVSGSGEAEPPQQPPEYAWARPAPAVSWAETEPLEYHRLFRGAKRFRWWKPLVALVLAALYFFTLSTVFAAVTVFPYLALTGAEATQESLTEMLLPDTQRPISLLLAFGSIILMIPAVWLALLSTGLGPLGRSWSVALRLRFRLFGRTLLFALAALLIINAVSIGLALLWQVIVPAVAETPAPERQLDWGAAGLSMLFALILVPFQASAEELVYRGLLMQVLGSWLRSPWLVIAVPAVLFGFSHLYDVWGWLAVVSLALCAGWVTWRTGGLEAAISLHVVNNLFALGFLALGFGGETGQTSDSGGPLLVVANLIGFALYAWWVDRDFRRRDGVRTRIDVVEQLALPSTMPRLTDG